LEYRNIIAKEELNIVRNWKHANFSYE